MPAQQTIVIPVPPSICPTDRRSRQGPLTRLGGGHRWAPPPTKAATMLKDAADMLDAARCAEALRNAVAFNAGLWRGIQRLVERTDRLPLLSDAQRALLHKDAAFVVAACSGASCPSDCAIETVIFLNRRGSDILATAAPS